MKQKTCMAAKVGAEKAKANSGKNPPKVKRVLWSNCLENLRKKYGVSLDDVAEAAGMTRAGVLVIERGICDPHLRNALAIAGFFGVSVTEIWTQWRGE